MAMELKALLILLVIIFFFSSWVFNVGFSRQLLLAAEGSGTNNKMASSCLQTLIPCQASMHMPSSPPPSACCNPLKEMIENDKECLCDVFNNESLLKSFNVTQEGALMVPKACGDEVDISTCTNDQDKGTRAMAPTTKNDTDSLVRPPSEDSASGIDDTTDIILSFAHGLLPPFSSSSSTSGVILITSVVASVSILL